MLSEHKAKGIEISEKDIGRKVVYRVPFCEIEEGIITSFNEHFVFVRYGVSCTSQATSPKDLDWVS